MAAYAQFNEQDLRLVYSVLHAHLTEHLDLMDSDFFDGLQVHLQSLAKSSGVDVSDHAQWASWLQGGIVKPRPKARLTLLKSDPKDGS